MKQKFIDAYMDIAKRFAQLSTANRLKVGAIIVKDERIISLGYNGTPPGWDNNCEKKEYMTLYNNSGEFASYDFPLQEQDGTMYRLKTKPEVIHAEANAIAKLAKSSESGNNSTMFLTHAPCIDCAKQIFTAGIKKVYFEQLYRSADGLNFLNDCGVDVERVQDK
jgi:dCMP deaminase